MCTRRMRRNVVRAGARWGFMAWVIVIGPAYADPLDVSYGSYACVVHRTVGLQSDATKQERFAGAIKQPVEAERFAHGVRRQKPACSLCVTNMTYGGNASPPRRSRFHRAKTACPCVAMTSIFSESGLGGWLHIIKGLKYTYAYPDYSGNFYLEEGVCQKQ